MKKIITSIFAITIFTAMCFGADAPFFVSATCKPVSDVGWTPMKTNLENPDAKAVYDFCKAFNDLGVVSGFSKASMYSFFDTAVEKFGINREAIEKAVKETILASDKQIVVMGNYSFGRYFVFTKEGSEFFNSLSPVDQKKLAYAMNEKALLCGLARGDFVGNMTEFKIQISKDDLTNSKILNALFFNVADCNNYKYNPVLKEFMDNNGITEIEYINAIMSYNIGQGQYSKNYQTIFLNKFLSNKTKAEKVKLIEAEIEGLLPKFDPDNTEQNKWLTKLRITKTIYTE